MTDDGECEESTRQRLVTDKEHKSVNTHGNDKDEEGHACSVSFFRAAEGVGPYEMPRRVCPLGQKD